MKFVKGTDGKVAKCLKPFVAYKNILKPKQLIHGLYVRNFTDFRIASFVIACKVS